MFFRGAEGEASQWDKDRTEEAFDNRNTRQMFVRGTEAALSLPAVRTEKAFHKVFVIRA